MAKNGQRHRVRHRKVFRSTQFESKMKLVLLSYLSLKMPKNRYFSTFRLGNLEIVTRWLKTDNGIMFGIEKSSGVHSLNPKFH